MQRGARSGFIPLPTHWSVSQCYPAPWGARFLAQQPPKRKAAPNAEAVFVGGVVTLLHEL